MMEEHEEHLQKVFEQLKNTWIEVTSKKIQVFLLIRSNILATWYILEA